MIIKGYIISIGYAFCCLLLSFILYKLHLPKKYTRKAVHILVGGEWFILYHFFGSGIHFLSVCLMFLALLLITYRSKALEMISSESSNAPGTIYYAVAMSGVALVSCFVPDVVLPFGIGVLCTSVGDGFAGVAGQIKSKLNIKIYGEKTLFGLVTNFIISTSSAFVMSYIYEMKFELWQCLAIGLLAAELEIVTGKGLDNISITWGVTALAYSFIYFENINNYLIPIMLSLVIFAFAYKKRALSKGGLVAASIVDIAVSVSLGNFGFLLLSTFFIGSVIVDKLKKARKNHGRNCEEQKGDCRDAMQVVANGATSAISALAYLMTQNKIFLVAFVAGLAEAFADTSASGIGIYANKAFDPFKWKRCDSGMSGGMSVIGTIASLFASSVIAFIPLFFNQVDYSFKLSLVALLCGFSGAVLDSLLGSLVQIKYRCSVCGKITEKEIHCSKKTVRHSGLPFVDNDVVNLISCAFSAVVSLLITIIVRG